MNTQGGMRDWIDKQGADPFRPGERGVSASIYPLGELTNTSGTLLNETGRRFAHLLLLSSCEFDMPFVYRLLDAVHSHQHDLESHKGHNTHSAHITNSWQIRSIDNEKKQTLVSRIACLP